MRDGKLKRETLNGKTLKDTYGPGSLDSNREQCTSESELLYLCLECLQSERVNCTEDLPNWVPRISTHPIQKLYSYVCLIFSERSLSLVDPLRNTTHGTFLERVHSRYKSNWSVTTRGLHLKFSVTFYRELLLFCVDSYGTEIIRYTFVPVLTKRAT